MQRPQRTRDEQMAALDAILYEAVILASAILLRDTRYFVQNYRNLEWGPAQIANDVIRFKCRLLHDFLVPKDRPRSVRKLIPWSGRAVVIPQQPTQPLAATNVNVGAPERAGLGRDQVVAEPLMVPLPVVVRHELVEHAQQAPFPEENQAVQTLLAN